MNDLLTPEQRDAIRKRATYNPPLDESAYEGSGFEQAIADVNALLRDREAIAERLDFQLMLLADRVPPEEIAGLRALVTAIRGEK